MVEGEEEYEVEEILDSRFRWGKLWYLVKFIGWSHSDNMWLPHMEVHTPTIVEEFHMGEPHVRSEEHTSELQSLRHLVCRLLLEKKKNSYNHHRLRTCQGHSADRRTDA